MISSYEKITTVTHKQLFIKVHVHAQKSPWTNHWQPLDCGLIIRWSCFKLPLYFPIILDVTHKLFGYYLLSTWILFYFQLLLILIALNVGYHNICNIFDWILSYKLFPSFIFLVYVWHCLNKWFKMR